MMRKPLDHLAVDHQHGVWKQIMLESIPMLSIIFLLLLALIPIRLPSAWSPGGLLPLLGLFYWLLVQPRLMKLWVVFCLGLLCDLALDMPLGCYSLAFVVLHTVLMTQRRFLIGQGFWLIWPAFAVCVCCVYTFVFMTYSLVNGLQIGWNIWEQGCPSVVGVCLMFPILLPFFHTMQRMVERMS
jgi:rod shape-determining protein MreD